MRIKLNGEYRDVRAQNIAELLEELNAPPKGVAIARNGQVVRRSEAAKTALLENDDIELIRAVQGG
jgi:sulfur carrier protein